MSRAAPIGLWACLGLAAAAGVVLAVAGSRPPLAPPAPPEPRPPRPRAGRIAAARKLNRASSLLAAAALADSALEHYRGAFHNRVMYLPLGVAAQALVAGLHGIGDLRAGAHPRRDLGHGAALATGIVGTGFHLYNITKRPGGFGWLNLFYAAPLGAPAALSLAGALGVMAERVRDGAATVCDVPTGPLLARLIAAGLVATAAEAGLLHFRGAYHNPAMAIPITVPPLAAALLMRTTLPPASSIAPARGALRLLTAVGFLGAAFHAYGIQRNMGGWRNWSQNLLNGPPLPAPSAFTALAMAGLAALTLIEEER